MNYIVFTKDLRMSSWENRFLFREIPYNKGKGLKDISDNYDKHPNYGFREKDDLLAKDHAFQVLRELGDNLSDDITVERLKGQFCQDVKNYIFTLNYLGQNHRGNARMLLQMMAELECEEELISIVREYYELFADDNKDEVNEIESHKWYVSKTFIPDYRKLYVKMGDKALFLKKDVSLAMRCYALADLDWYGILDEEYMDTLQDDLMKEQSQEFKEWHKQFEYYQKLFSGKATKADIQNDNTLTEMMKKAYLDVLDVWENEDSYKRIWEATTEYFIAMEEKFPSLQPVFSEFRSAFIIAYHLRDKALLPGILCLKKEEKKVSKRLRDAVLECVSNSNEMKLLSVKNYISEKSWTEKLWEQILLFVEAIYTIYNIRSWLLVQNSPSNMAYYTALETFFYMLPAKVGTGCGRLSVMNIAYMNDPNEGKILKRILFEGDDSYDKEGRQSVKYPYVFMKCFTSRIDDLPMWEMYGQHAKGCCLVLDWDNMLVQMENKKDVPLYRVCYVNYNKRGYQLTQKDNPHIPKIKEIKAGLDTLVTIADVLRDYPDSMECFMTFMEDILYLFKDSSYSYEEEMRIYYNYPTASDMFQHTGGEYPRLFVQPEFNVYLKEIIMGPKFENLADRMPYIQEQVEMLCRQTKAKLPKITMSGIEYR